MLTYSRATRVEGALSVVDLGLMVREIVETYPTLREVEIDISIPENSTVMGYEVALTQCISNLLGNSVKFMPPGGVPKIRVWTEDTGHFSRLLIKDNGIGIAAADQQRIFEIFARVHSEEVYEGTGIGLSIVKKAVEKMGGRVGLESEIGREPCFGSICKKARIMSNAILLVEDSEDDVFFMERAMKATKFSTTLQIARDPFADRDVYPLPRLVLLDLKLPHVLGLDILKWIRAQPTLAMLPVVILTSSGERSDLDRAYRLGANSFLVKPSDSDELIGLASCLKDYWFKYNLLPKAG